MAHNQVRQARWTRVSISIGVGGFLLALTTSAWLIPQLRLLHFFQALIYVAVFVLARRNSTWGFGAGVAISTAWNCLNLFVTHLFQAGAEQLWSFLRTGYMSQPVPFMVTIGGLSHFVIITACIAAFLKLRPDRKGWAQFFAGGLLVLAYFGLIISTTAPH